MILAEVGADGMPTDGDSSLLAETISLGGKSITVGVDSVSQDVAIYTRNRNGL